MNHGTSFLVAQTGALDSSFSCVPVLHTCNKYQRQLIYDDHEKVQTKVRECNN